MEANDDVAREPDAPSLEGELLEPSAPPAIGRPPGRKPVAPLHVVPPLTDEEVEILIADPGELLRRRAVHYLRWADSLVSESPSKINRVAFGVESQRRMIAHLLSISIPPSRPAIDGLGESRPTSDQELLEILRSLGPDPGFTNGQLRATQDRESLPEHEDLRPQ